jgi:hypothetical protein
VLMLLDPFLALTVESCIDPFHFGVSYTKGNVKFYR